MTEAADEAAALRAEREDLRVDREKLRELLRQHAFPALCHSILQIYVFQSVLPEEAAQEVDDRLAPIRQVIGWDPYPHRQCLVGARRRPGPPSVVEVLNRRYEDGAGTETLKAEVEELGKSIRDAYEQLETEMSRLADWMRSVAPEGTPYLGKPTDEATRRDVIGAWREAAAVLGIEVVAPYSVETDDGPLLAIALIVGLGSPRGTLLLDLNDFFECAPKIGADYRPVGIPLNRFRVFDRAVFEDVVDEAKRDDERRNPLLRLVRTSEPLCAVDVQEGDYLPQLHADTQTTDSPAWRLLLELIDQAAEDGREEFAPKYDMPRSFWDQIVTLPPSIGKLTRVKHLRLYGSNLVAIPPEIGQMTSLEVFTPYTSRRLHWFPYEITRCTALRASTVSTRHLYGNWKYRLPFPQLPAGVPQGSTPRSCSVCGEPLRTDAETIQVWISLRVATDTLPLLVHACSEECVRSLPTPQEGDVDRPHQGGSGLVQPAPADF
jgi:hypothetical protein